jgi:hypothetical protein
VMLLRRLLHNGLSRYEPSPERACKLPRSAGAHLRRRPATPRRKKNGPQRAGRSFQMAADCSISPACNIWLRPSAKSVSQPQNKRQARCLSAGVCSPPVPGAEDASNRVTVVHQGLHVHGLRQYGRLCSGQRQGRQRRNVSHCGTSCIRPEAGRINSNILANQLQADVETSPRCSCRRRIATWSEFS